MASFCSLDISRIYSRLCVSSSSVEDDENVLMRMHSMKAVKERERKEIKEYQPEPPSDPPPDDIVRRYTASANDQYEEARGKGVLMVCLFSCFVCYLFFST